MWSSTPPISARHRTGHTNSEAFILLHFGKKLVLIGGTQIRRRDQEVHLHGHELSVAPKTASFPCTARPISGRTATSAVFFGLSGTGKTTLSADPTRTLIGDDEHGWSDNGVFNFEGGCYAKVIRLSREAEPEIYECTRRFGTVLENVAIDAHSRRIGP